MNVAVRGLLRCVDTVGILTCDAGLHVCTHVKSMSWGRNIYFDTLLTKILDPRRHAIILCFAVVRTTSIDSVVPVAAEAVVASTG